ncbi:hypothetical protein ATANTOWER_021859 [Ataeniobius toweri]|uniref:Uncharacterized protein n=1 Tax=Ataeniobius toweri TaxID=208326 RepID=A0ABU7AZT6_9TELE|nr:hypothetical protein [Ataeniobius toweri]
MSIHSGTQFDQVVCRTYVWELRWPWRKITVEDPRLSWYFEEYMPCRLTRFMGHMEENQAHSITDPSLYSVASMTCFST